MPVIAFHGTADPLVPFAGGRLGDPFNPVKPVYPPIREFVAHWAARNGCAADPLETRPVPGISRVEYVGCTGGASVVFHEVEGAGHVWPGGKPLPEWRVGANSSAIDATRYPKGGKVSDAELAELRITYATFHPDWNYTILPKPPKIRPSK